MPLSLKFEDVSKLYRLGEVGTGTLSHDLHRAWAKFLGRPDPFAKIGQVNSRETRSYIASNTSRWGWGRKVPSEYVWALKDISLEVEEGEIVGVIGRNGAGKSTLLKLLSRVTAPSLGKISVKGRIASLLEVGTGFHPELTGRENIYLNGAILGMRHREITKQLSEIIDFSGCAKYIDTPVKRYSSGMSVRLGFAVAAHLECEILVVDEVLAVGDVEFQNRCIGKMKDITSTGRKTVLFVSHNMASIESLCNRGVVLKDGMVKTIDKIDRAIGYYFKEVVGAPDIQGLASEGQRKGSGELRLRNAFITTERDFQGGSVRCGERFKLNFHVENRTNEKMLNVSVGYSIASSRGEQLLVSYSDYQRQFLTIPPGMSVVTAELELPLIPGNYEIGCRIIQNNQEIDWPKNSVCKLNIEGGVFGGNEVAPHSGRGLFLIEDNWSVSVIE